MGLVNASIRPYPRRQGNGGLSILPVRFIQFSLDRRTKEKIWQVAYRSRGIDSPRML
jgi:hypothetical protein